MECVHLPRAMEFERYKNYRRILLFVFSLLLLWPALNSLSNSNDFEVFLGASRRMLNGLDMYHEKVVYDRYLHYYYSPFFAFIIQPFAAIMDYRFAENSILPNVELSMLLVKLVWNVLNMFFIYRICKYLLSIFQFETDRKAFWFYLIMVFLCYRWLHINIKYGQLTIFLLYAFFEAYFSTKSKDWLKWSPFALGMQIKILPIFFYWKMFLDKNYKAMILVFSLVIVITVIPFIFLDSHYYIMELQMWLKTINPLNSNHVVQTGEGGFMDIGSIVTKYFTMYRVPNEPRVCLTQLSISQMFWLTQVLRLLILGAITYLILELKKIPQLKYNDYLQFSLMCIGIPIIFPHQRDYSFALFIPAVSYVVYNFLRDRDILKPISTAFFFIGLLLMGCIVFFEVFSLDFRYWMIGVRLMGIGAIIFAIFFFLFVNQQIKSMKAIIAKP